MPTTRLTSVVKESMSTMPRMVPPISESTTLSTGCSPSKASVRSARSVFRTRYSRRLSASASTAATVPGQQPYSAGR